MADIKKVLHGLACCINGVNKEPKCEECPYADEQGTCEHLDGLHKDALALLKEQEPVKPYLDYDGKKVYRCGECGAEIFHPTGTQADDDEKNYRKHCFQCGKKVKWDGK